MKFFVSLIIFVEFFVGCGKENANNIPAEQLKTRQITDEEIAQCLKEDPTNRFCIKYVLKSTEVLSYDECEADRLYLLKNKRITQNEYNTLVKFEYVPSYNDRIVYITGLTDCLPKPKAN